MVIYKRKDAKDLSMCSMKLGPYMFAIGPTAAGPSRQYENVIGNSFRFLV